MPIFKLIRIQNKIQREVLVEIPDLSILTGTILAGNSVILDTNIMTNLRSLRYTVTVWTATKTKSFEILVVNDTIGVRDTIYGILGSVSLNVTVSVVGPNIELLFENNEIDTINYEIQKIITEG